jgi:type II secretory pathway component HofQ
LRAADLRHRRLIQTSVNASATKVPVLGDLPFAGTAFSR